MTRVPLATYRLQLNRDLTFDDAAALVPYLAALGITHCYTSPFFATASGSAHGYDVSDHNRFRDDLGGEPAFRRFAAALARHQLGLIVDIVPNHMGIAGNRNAWWADVLENGESSPYAGFFDIEWHPVKQELANKVLLPILGDQYGVVLDAGQLTLELTEGRFSVRYYDIVLPILPNSYARLLGHRLAELQARLGAHHPGLVELKSLVTWFVTIPPRLDADPARIAERRRNTAIGHERLAALLKERDEIRDFVEENLALFNGTPGDPKSYDLLDSLLAEQAYRLAFWRVAGEEINYRRFFDINELAAIRMEDPRVFEATHRLVLRLVSEGIVTGLRIDHPDGLYAPAEYFTRLQQACRAAVGGEPGGEPFYIVAEKILQPGERLPGTWPVAGTTGYEFLNLVNGIFVDRLQARAVEGLYTRLLRGHVSFAETVYESKRLVMETAMASELNMLGHRLNTISEEHRASRDFTLSSLIRALREIIASFPVYRSYVGDVPDRREPATAATHVAEADREVIARAVALARRRTPSLSASIYDWLHDILILRFPPWVTEEDRQNRLDFVMRFQQITAPVTAKGLEDTALYRYHRLVSLNEVGGDPSRFGTPLGEFHAENALRQRQTPHALSATSTHDTKRSEDVRARLNVLSEIPREWRTRVARWQRLNRRHRSVVDGQPAPGPNEEYLLYQTLVGAWPVSRDRLREYVFKAIHEAKVHTSWINPNARYDEAVQRFADGLLDERRSREFLKDFRAFQRLVAHYGSVNSLAGLLIKLTAPGIPDFYQGSELWDLSLVDPDNRRPVDWALRRKLLEEIASETEGARDLSLVARRLVEAKDDGRIKLFVTRQGLACRRVHPALFQVGDYQPLEVHGTFAEHVCAFARVTAEAAAITLVPRLLARRGIEMPFGLGYWEDTAVTIPTALGRRFRHVFTGGRLTVASLGEGPVLRVGDVLATFPVALLVREA